MDYEDEEDASQLIEANKFLNYSNQDVHSATGDEFSVNDMYVDEDDCSKLSDLSGFDPRN